MKSAFLPPATLGLAILAAWTIAPEPAATPNAEFILEAFDVARSGDVLLVPITLEGKKYHFVVDTGGEPECL